MLGVLGQTGTTNGEARLKSAVKHLNLLNGVANPALAAVSWRRLTLPVREYNRPGAGRDIPGRPLLVRIPFGGSRS